MSTGNEATIGAKRGLHFPANWLLCCAREQARLDSAHLIPRKRHLEVLVVMLCVASERLCSHSSHAVAVTGLS
jgi:hypothetical protein